MKEKRFDDHFFKIRGREKTTEEEKALLRKTYSYAADKAAYFINEMITNARTISLMKKVNDRASNLLNELKKLNEQSRLENEKLKKEGETK